MARKFWINVGVSGKDQGCGQAEQGPADIESCQRPKEYLEGYAELAEFIASDDDILLFRKFGVLGARNLLYLQAELQELEARLNGIDEENLMEMASTKDISQKMDVDRGARDWDFMTREAHDGNGRQAKKMKLILEIRRVMKEYQEALLLRSRVVALKAPEPNALQALRRWFRHKAPLLGNGERLLDDEKDILALYAEKEPDRLSAFVRDYLGYYLREDRTDQPRSWGPVYYFPEALIAKIVAVISLLVAALLLIGAVVALYFTHSQGKRLGVLGAFTLMFAGSVGLLTNAQRSEVFGATAAYAAVLVVFVSGNIGAP